MKHLLTRIQSTHARYIYIGTGGPEKRATSRQGTGAPQPAGSSNISTRDGCDWGTGDGCNWGTGGTGGSGGSRGSGGPLRHLITPVKKKLTGRAKILERLQITERSAGSSFIYKRRAEDTAA